MPLTKEEKNYIVDTVAEIMRAPDKKERIARLRDGVLAAEEGTNTLDDTVYSVIQAIDELYG